MSNCRYCKYYSEYDDGKFAPLPVCTRYTDLKSASEAIKNSTSCEFYKNSNDIHISFIELGESFKNLSKAAIQVAEKLAAQELASNRKRKTHIKKYKEAHNEFKKD